MLSQESLNLTLKLLMRLKHLTVKIYIFPILTIILLSSRLTLYHLKILIENQFLCYPPSEINFEEKTLHHPIAFQELKPLLFHNMRVRFNVMEKYKYLLFSDVLLREIS